MVKQRKKNKRKKCSSKGFTANTAKAGKINVSTAYTFAGASTFWRYVDSSGIKG